MWCDLGNDCSPVVHNVPVTVVQPCCAVSVPGYSAAGALWPSRGWCSDELHPARTQQARGHSLNRRRDAEQVLLKRSNVSCAASVSDCIALYCGASACCHSCVPGADGPDTRVPWLCFRCAAGAPGGLSKNWRVPRGKARQDTEHTLYIAAPQDENVAYDLFYRGRVLASHSDVLEVLWTDFEQDESNPERVERSSHRIWHGAMDNELWEDKGDYAFAPISRSQCPDTFAEIAQQNGVADPTAGMRVALATGQYFPPLEPAPPHEERPLVQSHSEASTSEAGAMQTAADRWLARVRAYGEQVGDEALQRMPSMLSMRRDMELHPYALWLVVQVRTTSLHLLRRRSSIVHGSRFGPLNGVKSFVLYRAGAAAARCKPVSSGRALAACSGPLRP